jgi:hypothetical protein
MMTRQEYEDRYAYRVYGKRKARVSDNADPERRGRIKVQNVELFGSGESDWALPCVPFYGGRDSGMFAVPPVGSTVWLEFEEGLIDAPIYSGGYFDLIYDGHNSDGSAVERESDYQNDPSSVPAHGRGVYDGSDFGGLKGSTGVPESSFEGIYGKVMLWQSPEGHMIEMDDTSGARRIQIHHAKGAHIEITEDGSINIISTGAVRTRAKSAQSMVMGSEEQETRGSSSKTVAGDFSTSVGGGASINVSGDSSTSVSGSVSYNVSGSANVSVLSLTAQMLNGAQMTMGGGLDMSCFGDLDLVSAGKGYLSFANTLSVPAAPYVSEACVISGTNGTMKVVSGDPSQAVSVYGMEARGGVSPQVYLGALAPAQRVPTLGVASVPLLKEPVVMGEQLLLFLNAVMTSLQTFYTTMSTGGVTPGFGGPNPVLAAASVAANAALVTAQTTFLTVPAPTRPLLLSEAVFISKV